MKMKKRTKQLQAYVDSVNETLRTYHVKQIGDDFYDLFHHLQTFLLHNDMYRGFNYYKKKVLEDGTELFVLAGTSDPDKFDFLQLY